MTVRLGPRAASGFPAGMARNAAPTSSREEKSGSLEMSRSVEGAPFCTGRGHFGTAGPEGVWGTCLRKQVQPAGRAQQQPHLGDIHRLAVLVQHLAKGQAARSQPSRSAQQGVEALQQMRAGRGSAPAAASGGMVPCRLPSARARTRSQSHQLHFDIALVLAFCCGPNGQERDERSGDCEASRHPCALHRCFQLRFLLR